MASQPKTPLKVVGSGSNFHRKLNLYQGIELALVWATREPY